MTPISISSSCNSWTPLFSCPLRHVIVIAAVVSSLFPSPSFAEQKSAAEYHVASLPGQPDGLLPKMHAGHIEVDHEKNGNLFFWHFESKYVADKPRTLLWLNGGPGCSSLDGALMEIGPFRLSNDHTLRQLNSSWNEFANVLFVDQPLGTGFSYANTDSLDHEMAEVADHMVTFLEKWFAIFPQYEADDLYIAGESYAGQHIPYIAKAIIDRNDRVGPVSIQWNLRGLLIGNGWISPREQYESYVKFSKQRGLLKSGTDAAKFVDEQMGICLSLFDQPGAYDKIDIGDCESVLTTIMSETEKNGMCYNMYDIRLQESYPSCGSNWPPDLEYLTPYLRRDDVKKALHINPEKKTGWEECSGSVSKQLRNLNSKPAVQLLPSLIEAGVPILLFSGADDMICNHIGTEDLIANLEWSNARGFGDAPRYNWLFGGEIIGFYQQARNLTYVLFYNSSHMVPFDHPARAVDMLNRFMGVDLTEIASVPSGLVLDGSNSTGTIDLDTAREKKLHEQELEEMRVQSERRLRSAVRDTYLKVITAGAFIFCVTLASIATVVYCRRRHHNKTSPRNDLGSYARVAEDEDAISLMRVPKQSTFNEDNRSSDVDESQLPMLHNVPEITRTSTPRDRVSS